MAEGNNPKLRAEITTTFDGKGTDEAKRALTGVGEAATESGSESKAAAAKTEEATKRTTDATFKARDAVRGLALEFPFLARVAHAALNPITAAVGLAVAAFSKLFSALQELRNLTTATITPMRNLAGAMDSQRDAAADAQLAAAEFQRTLAQIGKEAESTKGPIDELTASILAQARAEGELQDAHKELARAKLHADEATGQISAEDAITKRAEIEESFARRRVDLENKTSREVVELRVKELNELLQKIGKLEAELAEKREAASKLGTEKQADDRLTAARKQFAIETEQLNKIRADIDRLETKRKEDGSLGARDAGALKSMREETLAIQEQTVALAKLRVEKEEARKKASLDSIKSAKEDVGRAERDLLQTRTRSRQLVEDLPGMEQKMLEEETQRKSLFSVQSETRSFQTRAALAPLQPQTVFQPTEHGGTRDDPNSPFRGTLGVDTSQQENAIMRAGDEAARAAEKIADAAVGAFGRLTMQLDEVDKRLRRIEAK